MADINFSVPYSFWRKLSDTQKNILTIIPLITVIIFAWYANTYFQQLQQYKSKAAGNTINVKDYGAKGDGLTNDSTAINNAMTAANVGDKVFFPAGTYYVNYLISLKSGVSVQGSGIDQTNLFMPAKTDFYAIFQGTGIDTVTISDLTLSSTLAQDFVNAIQISSYSNVTIERVKVTNTFHALKADTQGLNLTVRNFTVRNCGQVYLSNLTNGLIENTDVEVVTDLPPASRGGVSSHALYLSQNSHHVIFNNTRWRGGTGVVTQLWHDTGPDTYDVVFNGLDVAGFFPMAINDGNYDVTINNATFVTTDSGLPAIMVTNPYNVTIDGFTAIGGAYFLQNYSGYTTHDITIKNGSFNGNNLIYSNGSWITNLTIQNVTTPNGVINPVPTSIITPSPTSTPKTATILTSPLSGNYTVGQTFNVDLKVNGGGQAFNAASATINVSSNLQIQGLTVTPSGSGGCNFIWANPASTPSVPSPSFAGAILNNSSTSCNLYTLSLKALSSGAGTVTLSNGSVKSYVGANEILNTLTSGSFTLTSPTTTTATPVLTNTPTPTLKPTSTPTPTPTPIPTNTPTPVPTNTPTPVVLSVPIFDSFPNDTYKTSITLSGKKSQNISTIYVNNSTAAVTFPNSLSWSIPVSLTTGANTFSVYGKDVSGNLSSISYLTIKVHSMGDISGDGVVDLTDLSLFGADYKNTGTLNSLLSDMNSDSKVDLTDFSIIATHYDEL